MFYSESGQVIANCNQFGYIGTTPLIFSASLRENILYGNIESFRYKLINELKLFDTFKEESGYDLDGIVDNKSLSSGQMQKIAFIEH